jgi:hypothetical protein
MTKKALVPLIAVAIVATASGFRRPQSNTQKEVEQRILEASEYSNKNLRQMPGIYSREGALEFWSSGGLLQEVIGGGPPRSSTTSTSIRSTSV